MKVLYIIDNLRRGGKEKQLTELVKSFYTDYSITIICFNYQIEYEELNNLPIKLIVLKRRKTILSAYELYKLTKQIYPDIIHTWDIVSTLLIIPSAVLLRIKIINGSIRGSAKRTFYSKYKFLANISFLFSKKVIANSKAGLSSLRKKENDKFKIIYNGFDFNYSTNVKNNIEIRDALNIETPYIVGMVSNFREGKDYATLLISAAKILKRRNDITFLLIGDGNSFWHLQKKYCSNNILFLGKQKSIESFVNAFSVGVLLAKTCKEHGEGISNSIMEYMAFSKPVIATDSGGNSEIVLHNKTGFIISQDNPSEFEERLELLIDNYELRKTLGNNGREFLYENFNLSSTIQNYQTIYNSLI